MNQIETTLLDRIKYLETIIDYATLELSKCPDGSLRVSTDASRTRYYHYTRKKGIIHETYLSQKDIELTQTLAQKSYYLDLIASARQEIKQINRFMNRYNSGAINQVYDTLRPERKSLVTPIEVPWEEYLAQWMAEEYDTMGFADEDNYITTERGERVRSKSEKITADFFYHHNIPYKYEHPLFIPGRGIIYPDFTILSPRTRKEFYWEHFGMMDNPQYAKSAINKIRTYEANGYYFGINLIYLFESSTQSLNTSSIQSMLDQYIL